MKRNRFSAMFTFALSAAVTTAAFGPVFCDPAAPIAAPAAATPPAPSARLKPPAAQPPITPGETVTPQPETKPLPSTVFDTVEDSVGIAQQTAQAKGLQGRIMWIDAGANVGALNTPEKIRQVVAGIKAAGFNMIVVDVKPIVGETIYPSKYAPRLTAWKGQTVSPDLDVLGAVVTEAHAAGLTVYANMSTFGEGHKLVSRGLAYAHPDWQTTMYLSAFSVEHSRSKIDISVFGSVPKDGRTLGGFIDAAQIQKNKPGTTVAVLNFDARVVALVDGASLSDLSLSIPPRGSVLAGTGAAGEWLKEHATPGELFTYAETPKYVPVVDDPDQKYTVFCDPLNPEVRQHELDIVQEVLTNYPVDGMVFDDRMRFAGINADFGPRDRAAFEAVVGKKLTWPDDIFRNSQYPGQAPRPGPYLNRWLTFRARQISSWLADASSLTRKTRPGAQVAVYVGSWYGDYHKLGSNWAAPDFPAPYSWSTPEYRAAGYAGMLDWITTGCYYYDTTVAEAMAKRDPPGATVEAAGQLSNRVVNDSAWTYAGLYALVYNKHPEQFARAIKAAAASSQGVMVFDLSQIMEYNWWGVIADAFGTGTPQPPNMAKGLLDTVRRQHAADKAAGKPTPPLPPYQGIEDTGL